MRSAAFVGFALGLAASTAAAAPPIIGGTAAKVGDFPTVVAIEVGQGLCTGTLIADEWIMTAAHCLLPAIVGSPDLPTLVKSIRVVFESVDVSKAGGRAIGASEVFGDPKFDVNNLGQHDMGLIHLASAYDGAAPTPVNFTHDKAPVGVSVAMVGFGESVSGNPGSAGTELMLSSELTEACALVPGGMGLPVLSDDNVLCFSQTSGKGKCEGDSGGPSFAMIGATLTVVGVTSFGDQDCAQFGVDTRTDAEHDFLIEHLPDLDSGGGGCCDAGHKGGPTSGICLGIVLLGLRIRRRVR